MRIVVLISNAGTGTNLQAIIDSGQNVVAVISDKPDAPGLERARKHGIPIEICPKKEDLLPLLQNLRPDYICLAGWKQIILDEVILNFKGKILNLHPGLIPDTMDGVVKNPDGTDGLWNKGMLTTKAIQNFLDHHATYAGSSIHFLTLEFDFGPVLGRVFEKIEKNDTVETLYARLKQKENQLWEKIFSSLEKAGGKTH